MKKINFQNRGQGLIGIIIILAIVALIGGGYYYFSKEIQKAPEVPQKPAGKSTSTTKEISPLPEKIEETTNWKTYRNEKYGFEIKYPYWYQVSDKLVREGFYDYQISRIVSFSNVLDIYADNSSSNLAKCLKNYENKDLTQTKEIGGNKFYIYFDKVRDDAMGGEKGLKSQYRIIHNNYCYILHYEFSWRVATGGTKEGGAEPSGTETPEQEAYIEKQIAELELMLSTFRFLK